MNYIKIIVYVKPFFSIVKKNYTGNIFQLWFKTDSHIDPRVQVIVNKEPLRMKNGKYLEI